MLELNELMTEVNKYITEVGEDKANPPVVAKAAQFVTRMLRIFGVAECEEIGLGAAGGGNAEEAVAPIMDAFAEFREIVRNEAKAAKVSSLLKACDEVRDVSLVNAGIRLEDRPGQTAAWRMEDAEALKKEMAEKEARKAEEMIGKIENKVNLAKADLKKFTEASLPPKEQLLNKNQDKYKNFDPSTGYPTLTIGDEEISKKAKKGLEADMKKMEKAHADFQAKAEKEGGAAAFLAKLEENVRDLEAQLEKTKALATGTK
jgi:cysteinyl-tRNA synthetase